MITKVKVSKLFGIFDYEFDLKKGGLTIITGPNGYGKSTLLRIMNGAICKNKKEFSSFVFDEIEVHTKSNELFPIYGSLSSKGICVSFPKQQTIRNKEASLIKKRELFKNIMDEKDFAFKRIKLSKKDDPYAISDDGCQIDADELSYGEWAIVAQIHELIFLVPQESTVFIHFPENYLHVAWQKKFINDIKRIMKLKKLQVVIATHSPQIIGEHWDLTIDLWDLTEKAKLKKGLSKCQVSTK